MQQAIRVIPRERTRRLDPLSRLDFFDIHELGIGLENVLIFGKVDRDSRGPLLYQSQAVWSMIRLAAGMSQGAISRNELDDWLKSLRTRASELSLPGPPDMPPQQRVQYAASPQLRSEYFEEMQKYWANELARKAQEIQREREAALAAARARVALAAARARNRPPDPQTRQDENNDNDDDDEDDDDDSDESAES